jgi:hypothetical protein
VSCNIDALHGDWMNIPQKKQLETLINGCDAEQAIMLHQAPKSLEESIHFVLYHETLQTARTLLGCYHCQCLILPHLGLSRFKTGQSVSIVIISF